MPTTDSDLILSLWEAKPLAASLPSKPATLEWWTIAPEAREFARQKHEGQRRKDSEQPYFVHLAEVAMIIGGFGEAGLIEGSSLREIIAAAWLHDTVEDCGVEISEIEESFGPQVAAMVAALTKQPKSDANQDPMSDSLARIAHTGPSACIVKTADRISNLSWMPPASWPSKQIRRYGQEGRHIAATLSVSTPYDIGMALELVADAYLKNFGSLGHPAKSSM